MHDLVPEQVLPVSVLASYSEDSEFTGAIPKEIGTFPGRCRTVSGPKGRWHLGLVVWELKEWVEKVCYFRYASRVSRQPIAGAYVDYILRSDVHVPPGIWKHAPTFLLAYVINVRDRTNINAQVLGF